jgi:hypothetical protein
LHGNGHFYPVATLPRAELRARAQDAESALPAQTGGDRMPGPVYTRDSYTPIDPVGYDN